MVKTKDSLILFIDGQKENATYSYQSLNSIINYNIDLGCSSILWEYFIGSIDEFSVWRKALSETEITNLMQNQLIGDESSLITYYNFNESAEDEIVLDKTINNNNAKIQKKNLLCYSLIS